ncbi:DUF2529 family protein [Bacillus solimangrovi]|uniref:DUF2529 domain-containing protein n=1 Tax=Bacillus solimangrovi TaxID=1305675 RepID=A0A1E5LGT0_9BACI|nr:DUF2529 family protein [Bacillus solimangrovi]OEH93288.1 hypothetical protein BFG57_12235 [Bacillus solimangrovi]
MLRIFTTQLSGIFQQIQKDEEMNIEDASRALAQAIVGEGSIYLHGIGEMSALVTEGLLGKDSLPKSNPLFHEDKIVKLSSIDRVILAVRSTDNEEVRELLKQIKETGASIILLASKGKESNETIEQIADFFINLNVTQGLVPQDDGTRRGFPATIVMLYTYYALLLTTIEIVEEQEENF